MAGRISGMLRVVRMAWRNVWRNGRRSVVTIAAMSLGLWVAVLYSGMVTGMIQDMATTVTDLELGEVQIVAEGYRDDPSMHVQVEEPDAIVQRLEGAGYPVSARLLGGGLAAVDNASAGVSLTGLDVDRDARVTEIQERVAAGQWLDPADEAGVVIGGKLAKTLEADIGDELLVLSQGLDGSIANDLYTVRGILGSVGAGVDRGAVFMNAPAFRELMVMPTGAHQLTVRVAQDQDLDAAKAEVVSLAPGTDVQTWKELMPLIAQWLQSTETIVAIVYFIMYIAIGILVLNAMLMAVFERIREFGVMKAIGYSPSTVFWLITIESAMQATIATLIGLVLAVPVAFYLQTTGVDMGALAGMDIMGMSMMENWKGVYTVQGVAVPVVMLWFMVTAAATLPAMRAAAIKPVTAMRYR